MQKKSKKNGVLLFIKYPKIGSVKSRLSSQIDKTLVVSLYKCFVKDILDMLKDLNYDILICYYPNEKLRYFKRWIGEKYQYISQNGKDLGERLKNSFIQAFNQGFDKLVVIGSDSPDLPKNIVKSAFLKLEKFDSVIGPCKDGGYYLLGFTNQGFSSNVFHNIPWSTSDVFVKTKNLLEKESIRTYILPIWQDIDTIEDLKDFYLRNKDSTFKTSNTMKILEDCYEINDS